LTYIKDTYLGMLYQSSLPLERAMTERPHDERFGMPSPEALKTATALIRRRYLLPDTMQHPQVRSECMRLAYLIQAYGLAATPSLGEDLWSPSVEQASPASSSVREECSEGLLAARRNERVSERSAGLELTYSSPIGG
jgi:hypothetical protein